MSSNSEIPEDKHLQAAMYGTPKVNPDEQRKYLGTFRERVSLTISVGELEQNQWTEAFKKELADEHSEIIFFNGNIEQEHLKEYIILATKAGVNFTLKTNPEYKTGSENFAIVIASKKAIYVEPIDVAKKYDPDTLNQSSEPSPKKSFFARLFNHD